VKHADALIELLSALTNSDLRKLGLSAEQVDALHDVWEVACDHYREAVGSPHPLENPTPADDRDMPAIRVTHPNPMSMN